MLAPRLFHEDYPWLQIDVVEIDPKVAWISKRYFLLPDSNRLRVISGQDGRMFISASRDRYDLIVSDVFCGGGRIPFHLLTKEYFLQLREHLMTSAGVAAFNLGGSLTGRDSRLVLAVYRTLQEVFPQVYIFPNYKNNPSGDIQKRNMLLIATLERSRLSQKGITEAAAALEGSGRVKAPIREYAGRLWEPEGELALREVPILTDDYAPVDSMTVD